MFKHTLTAVLNKQRPDKYNKYALRIRSTIQRKVVYYATGIMLMENQLKAGEIVNHPNKTHLNILLRTKMNEIEKDLLEESITGEPAGAQRKKLNLTFNDYALNNIKKNENLWSKSTVKHKHSYLRKLNTFKPDLKLKDVDKDLLSDFEKYCKSIGNIPNTVWSATKYLKTVISAAVEDGTLVKNPLKGFKGTKYTDPLRNVLTQPEITLIENFADNSLNNPKLINTAAWFIFGVYTGLRYADMVNFKGLVNDKILLQTQKTNSVVSIFATEQIKRAVARLTRPVFTNQKCNEYIGAVCAIVGINKKISMHSSRHSFAVNFLEKGGRIEILSALLGHSTLRTTQIYAKISTTLADEEMKKVWG